MSSAGSVTRWIQQLKAGEEDALIKLWQRYWPHLVRLAGSKLSKSAGRAADDEDVAQEAFWGFYESFRAGRLPRLKNRHDLMALLVVIITRKAASLVEHERRQKRGAGQIVSGSSLEFLASGRQLGRGIEHVADGQPSPEEQVIIKEQFAQYVAALADDLRPFAELYLAGYSKQEIAERIGCVKRTVDRKMPIIFDHWQAMAEASMNGDEGKP